MNRAVQFLGVAALLWSTWGTLMFPCVVLGLCALAVLWGYIKYEPADDAIRQAMLDEGWEEVDGANGPFMRWRGTDHHPELEPELPYKPVWPHDVGAVE